MRGYGGSTLDFGSEGPGHGCTKKLKIKCMGISTTVPCFVEDFFAPSLCFLYSLIHLQPIYP